MGRTCSVCAHEESFTINEALVIDKQSNRSIAKQYGLNHSAVQRHREHIPELLLKGSRALEVFEADVILDRLESLWEESIAVLEAAKDDGSPRLVLSAIDRAGKQLERLAELRGDISRQPVANLVLSAEWVELKGAIIGALREHPRALEAVRVAISDGGTNGQHG